jgi:hypothetical protein
MPTLVHYTGREYNGKQVLEIDAPAMPDDPTADVRVMFTDESRNIVGVVTLMAVELLSGTGDAVLREYDAGRFDYMEI